MRCTMSTCTPSCGALAQQYLGKADDGIHGVRSSWDMVARNWDFSRAASIVAGSVARFALLALIHGFVEPKFRFGSLSVLLALLKL